MDFFIENQFEICYNLNEKAKPQRYNTTSYESSMPQNERKYFV